MKKLYFLYSMLMLLAISIPSAWAADATFGSDWNNVFGTNYSGSISGVKANALTLTGTVNSVTLTATNGSSTNGYLKTSDWRLYNGYTLTIAAPQNNIITAIVATKGGKSISGISTTTGNLTIAQDGSSMSWSGEANQVVFNVTATMGFAQIQVTYSSNSTPSKTLSSIAISGTPTKTAYNAGQDFEPAGLTVTGTYSDASSAPIASGITWSYDPSATLSLNQTSIKVKATVDAIESSWFTVNGLTITQAPAADIYELITNASDLSEGDEIIIANETAQKAMSTTQNTNNRGAVGVTIANDAVTPGDGVQIITLGKSNGNWTLYTGNGYLYASSSSANQLKTQANNNANGEWTISISDGVATLTAQGTNTHNVMQYNSASSLFACYASASQAPVKIYKKSDGSTPKAAAGLAYAEADLSKLVKLGDAFTAPTLTNPNSLAVTYASDNTTVAEVASNGAVTIKAVGKAVITASSEETENYKAGSASYTIYVTAHAGTEADPYTVADARLAIDCGAGVTGVYATGIVSEIVTPYNSQYGNISYNISTDGQTTSDQLQAFRGKAKDGENFTSADDVKVGDEVVVKGNLTKYNSTYEFAADNQLYSLTRNKEDAGLAYAVTEIEKNIDDAAFTNALTNPHSLAVTYSSSAEAVATVDANGVVTIVGMGTTTITASFAGDASYITGEASYTLSVNDPSLTKVTFDATVDKGESPLSKSNITLSCSNGVLNNESEYRLYKNSTTTFACSAGNITMIEFIGVSGNPASGFAAPAEGHFVTDGNNATWTGNATSVSFEASGAQVRATKIVVSYREDTRAEAGLAYETEEVEKTVGDDAFVNALTNPNSVAVTYESSNTNVAEIANNGSVTIKAQGSATISATFAGDETYKPATVTYTITVNPASEDTRKTAQDIDGFDAINGNLNNDISFASNQGDGTAAPNLKDGSIQYYQPGSGKASGGYMTITAVNGCKIDQVKVVTATNATSIKYSKDDGDLSEATEVETGADYLTPAALNAQTVNIYCAGADKNHRLFIAQVVVYYTGEPVAVDHLILSGEYQTEFVQGDEFNHDGLIVTAAYDAQGSETVDVTAQAVVTAPDMSTTGEKTITVSFGGKEATYTINVAVNTDLDDLSGTWVLVTDASQLVAGKKVIIAEAVESDGEVESMGVQNNNNRAAIVSTVASGILSPNTATKTFTLVDAGSSKWALQGTDSKYLYAASSSSNYLKSQDEIDDNATWTIGIENSKAAITANGTNTRNIIRFNSTSSLFSCYASGQSDIALYIQQEDTPEPPTPDWTEVRSELTIGKHYTICLKKKITAVNGATFWTIGKHTAHKVAYLEEAKLPLAAGEPFIFQATADKLEVVYEGEDASEPAIVIGNALRGTFEDMDAAALAAACTNMYMLSNNQICSVTHNNGNFLSAFRAYIDDDAMSEVSSAPQPAPGRKVKSVPMQGNVATGIDETHTSMQATKMLIDGQLFIICGEKMYDVTGSLVK